MTHSHYRKKFRFVKEMYSLPTSIKLISLVMFIYYIGWGIATPYFPLFLKEVLGSYTAVGLVTGLLPLFSILVYLFIGPLCDRVSKRKVVSLMLLLYLPYSFVLLGLKSIISFVYFRVYHAFIATSLWTASDSYLREHSSKGKGAEAIGMYDSFYTFSLVIGPIIGAFLFMLYGYNIFYAISAFALLAFFVSLRLHAKRGKRLFSGIRDMLRDHFIKREFSDFMANKELVRISLFVFLFYLGTSIIGMTVPLFLRSIDVDFFQIGLAIALFNVPWVFESYFSTAKNKRKNILLGIFFAIVLLFTMFFAKDLRTIAVILFLLGMCNAAVLPIIQGRITELMPKKEIGELVGVNNSIWNIATGFGPLFAGIFADKFGLQPLFLVLAFLFLALLLIAHSSKSFYFEKSKLTDGVQKL
ncbi:MAG: MFS transporter [Nanoarchaeota archaeon]